MNCEGPGPTQGSLFMRWTRGSVVGILFPIFTVSGPLLGAAGHFFDLRILFWFGVALSVVNLLMNVASRVMTFPILPLLFTIVGASFLAPWYVGAGVGLLAWTAIEAAGEVLPIGFL